MKKILIILFITCAISLNSQAQYSNTKIKPGQDAPELAYENPEGELISLKKINKKRIVLIDFWASWCGPCRMASPAVVAFYKKYSAKKFSSAKNGFTIVSVSLDQNKAPWKEAIAKDKLEWPYHMSDLGGWNSKAAAEYGVVYVPQCILIDANGKVIGTYNKVEDCEKDLEKLVKK